MKAHLRRIRTSPKKMQVVAGIIRGMQADKAISFLEKVPQKTALYLKKVIKSALSNAEAIEKLSGNELVVSRIDIQDGPRYKRFKAGSRGMAIHLQKRTIHLSIYLAKK